MFRNITICAMSVSLALATKPLFSSLPDLIEADLLTPNQKVIAIELESIKDPTPEETTILQQLNAEASSSATIDQARRSLSQMSGDPYTSSILVTELANRQFLRRLYTPLRPLLETQPSECSNYSYDCYGNYQECLSQIPPTAWIEASGGRKFLDRSNNSGGFKMDSYQIDLGFQRTLDKYWTIGIAAGYEFDEINYDTNSSGQNNTVLLGFYSLYRPESFYILSDLIVGFNSNRVTRRITVGDMHYKAEGTPNCVQGTVYVEGGKDLTFSNLLIQPFLGFELSQYSCKSFKEKGAAPLNLSLSTKNKTQVFSRLGVHLSTGQIYYVNVNVDLAWQYRLNNPCNTIREHFADFGDSFIVQGVSIPRNSFDGTVNISTKINETWTIYTELSGQRWNNLSAYNIMGGVMCDW